MTHQLVTVRSASAYVRSSSIRSGGPAMRVIATIPNFKVGPSCLHGPNHRLTPANPLAFPSVATKSVGAASSARSRDPIRLQRQLVPINGGVMAGGSCALTTGEESLLGFGVAEHPVANVTPTMAIRPTSQREAVR